MNQQKETHHQLPPTTSPSGKPSKAGLTRRYFLKLGVGTALTLPALVSCQREAPQDPATPAAQDPATVTPAPQTPSAQEALVPTATPELIIDPDVSQGQPLRSIPEIPSPSISSGVPSTLETTLAVQMMMQRNVAVKVRTQRKPKINEIKLLPQNLRNYYAPRVGSGEPDFPGPTLRAKPGDTVQIDFWNKLPPVLSDEDLACRKGPEQIKDDVMPNCFHGDNVTNLHYHGFHVTPKAPGDDVFLRIYPEGSDENVIQHPVAGQDYIGKFDYNFDIPLSQPPGTHWYHAHKHGSTGLQVLNGMAGAFIIEGDFDQNNTPGFPPKETEKLLVIQQILEQVPLLQNPIIGGGVLHAAPLLMVNGQLSPVITMRPGEVQRWRIVSATMQASAKIESFAFTKGDDLTRIPDDQPKPRAFQIAMDGVQYLDHQWQQSKDERVRTLDLASGNRADFLVKAPQEPGDYHLWTSQEGLIDQALHSAGEAESGGPTTLPTPNLPLLTIKVDGPLDDMPLPEHLPTFDQLPEPLKPILKGFDEKIQLKQRTLTFNQTGNRGGQGPEFTIDGRKFCPTRVDHCIVLGTAEEWKIENYTGVEHPFHIHVNPFYVTEIHDPNSDSQQRQTDRWQDTIALPPVHKKDPTKPGYVVIRHRFLHFTGKYVLHCHILGHEDRGMMQVVEVIDGTPEEAEQIEKDTADACPEA